MAEAVSTLSTLLAVSALALLVRLVTDRFSNVSYSVTLVLVGFVAAALNVPVTLALSHDLIVAVFLPTLLFHGAVELDHGMFERNWELPLVLVLVGLPLTIVLFAVSTHVLLALPLAVATLLATIVSPTDPAAVLSLFDELDAPERLSAIVDSESLLNDGVAIVFFTVVLGTLSLGARPPSASQFLSLVSIEQLAVRLVVVGVGGFLVGALAGYLGRFVTRYIDDPMGTVLFTLLLAYGSYVLAEHYLGVSGVLATVGAGLALGLSGEFTERSDETRFVRTVWDTAAFLVTTVVYLLIGTNVRFDDFVARLDLVLVVTVLVVLARAVAIYLLFGLANRVADEDVPFTFQHVMVWGGLHTVVPVALVLSLPDGVPRLGTLRTLVFGVAVVGTVIQGLLMPFVLRATGMTQ
ncbi:cation:proton antiporter [Haloprofundus salinisoli]|uniref:cation:proton antiporter n=1 Tax=Haloprofundus salinisoli TaxID=2876193 RepID=UPI001CCDAE5C|nr:cation:proton antiporter [Haloprofundus salinisoli]